MSSIFPGACAAATRGPLHIGWLALTVFGIFAIEVAKNASGELFDFDSGTDQAGLPVPENGWINSLHPFTTSLTKTVTASLTVIVSKALS